MKEFWISPFAFVLPQFYLFQWTQLEVFSPSAKKMASAKCRLFFTRVALFLWALVCIAFLWLVGLKMLAGVTRHLLDVKWTVLPLCWRRKHLTQIFSFFLSISKLLTSLLFTGKCTFGKCDWQKDCRNAKLYFQMRSSLSYIFPMKDLQLRARSCQNRCFAGCQTTFARASHLVCPILPILSVANQVSWLVLEVSCSFCLPRHHLVKYVGCPCNNGRHFSECSRAVKKETISKEWIRRTKAHSKILNEQKPSGREDADFNQHW